MALCASHASHLQMKVSADHVVGPRRRPAVSSEEGPSRARRQRGFGTSASLFLSISQQRGQYV